MKGENFKWLTCYREQNMGVKRDATSSVVGPGPVTMTSRESFSVGGSCVGDSQADRIDGNAKKQDW